MAGAGAGMTAGCDAAFAAATAGEETFAAATGDGFGSTTEAVMVGEGCSAELRSLGLEAGDTTAFAAGESSSSNFSWNPRGDGVATVGTDCHCCFDDATDTGDAAAIG